MAVVGRNGAVHVRFSPARLEHLRVTVYALENVRGIVVLLMFTRSATAAAASIVVGIVRFKDVGETPFGQFPANVHAAARVQQKGLLTGPGPPRRQAR
jgi:hypothetical protein